MAPDPCSKIRMNIWPEKCTVLALAISIKILLFYSLVVVVLVVNNPLVPILGSLPRAPGRPFSVGSFCVRAPAVGPSGVHLSTTPATTLIIRLNTTFSILLLRRLLATSLSLLLLYIIFILHSTQSQATQQQQPTEALDRNSLPAFT